MKIDFKILFLSMMAVVWPINTLAAGQEISEKEIMSILTKDIQIKTRVSGMLDIYDEQIKKVRNLRISENGVSVVKSGDDYMGTIESRDVNSGATVTMQALLVNEKELWKIKDYHILKVTELGLAKDTKKQFSDAEIQEFFKKYFEQQAKLTGNVPLYDEENKKLRKLELVNLYPGVKHFGTIAIVKGNFKDVESGEQLGIDVTMENKYSRLNIQSMLIREVRRP